MQGSKVQWLQNPVMTPYNQVILQYGAWCITTTMLLAAGISESILHYKANEDMIIIENGGGWCKRMEQQNRRYVW
jgi:hypothetical protein